jgi:N-acetylglucosaminyldiphosphoundecaprenol N-acetyl-beta-D-mannosaminyltransferase
MLSTNENSQAPMMNTQVVILGVPIDSLSISGTIDQLEEFIEAGRLYGKGHQIATVNADFITNALRDPVQMSILQKANLAMPDGMPVALGARFLGAPSGERVAGVDVVLGLAERAVRNGYSMFLLGAAPDVAALAAENLQAKFPGLRIVGVRSPIVRSIDETAPQILEEIRAAHPDILLVAFGNPKQELWISKFADHLNVPVMIGVGGTLDFISGCKRRAPVWVQQSGLEWAHRLSQEPRRLWRRYGRNILIFGPQFARQWLVVQMHRRSVSAPLVDEFILHDNAAVIRISRSLTKENWASFVSIFKSALLQTVNLYIDLSQADYLDSTALGGMVRLAWEVRDLGGEIFLAGVPKKIFRQLSASRLENFFQITQCLYPLPVARHEIDQDQIQTWQAVEYNRLEVISKV